MNRLLNQELSGGANEDSNFPISKACQIAVDAATLAKMTTELEKLLQAGMYTHTRTHTHTHTGVRMCICVYVYF